MGRIIRETVVPFASLPVDLQDAANAEGGAWTSESYTDDIEEPAINGYSVVASDGRYLAIVKKESDAPVTVVISDLDCALEAICQVDD